MFTTSFSNHAFASRVRQRSLIRPVTIRPVIRPATKALASRRITYSEYAELIREARPRTRRRRPDARRSHRHLPAQLLGVLRRLPRRNARRSSTHFAEPELSRARSALPVGKLRRGASHHRWPVAPGNQSRWAAQPAPRLYHAPRRSRSRTIRQPAKARHGRRSPRPPNPPIKLSPRCPTRAAPPASPRA